jgi:hypothetical protein
MQAERKGAERVRNHGINAEIRTIDDRESLRCISAPVTAMPCDAKAPGPKPVAAKCSWPGDSGGRW